MNLQKEQSPFDEPNRQQLAKTAQDVEKMQLANELISQGERLRSAILQQRELADRMAQFRDRPTLGPEDLQRLQRFAKEQELLRQELDEAKSDLEKTARKAHKALPRMSGGRSRFANRSTRCRSTRIRIRPLDRLAEVRARVPMEQPTRPPQNSNRC